MSGCQWQLHQTSTCRLGMQGQRATFLIAIGPRGQSADRARTGARLQCIATRASCEVTWAGKASPSVVDSPCPTHPPADSAIPRPVAFRGLTHSLAPPVGPHRATLGGMIAALKSGRVLLGLHFKDTWCSAPRRIVSCRLGSRGASQSYRRSIVTSCNRPNDANALQGQRPPPCSGSVVIVDSDDPHLNLAYEDW